MSEFDGKLKFKAGISASSSEKTLKLCKIGRKCLAKGLVLRRWRDEILDDILTLEATANRIFPGAL